MPDEREIRTWFIDTVAALLAIPRSDVDPAVPFAELGLSSQQGVLIADQLSAWLSIRVPPEAVFDHPTILRMAHFLSRTVDSNDTGSRSAPEEFSVGEDDEELSAEEILELINGEIPSDVLQPEAHFSDGHEW